MLFSRRQRLNQERAVRRWRQMCLFRYLSHCIMSMKWYLGNVLEERTINIYKCSLTSTVNLSLWKFGRKRRGYWSLFLAIQSSKKKCRMCSNKIIPKSNCSFYLMQIIQQEKIGFIWNQWKKQNTFYISFHFCSGRQIIKSKMILEMFYLMILLLLLPLSVGRKKFAATILLS